VTLFLRSFHSPAQPSRYIKLRIEPMIAFYSRRLPVYTRHGLYLKMAILTLGVAASVLARYSLLTWVTTVTAAAAVTTSWAEFTNASHKVKRYSSAINALENLLSIWDSWGDVQKASRESISNLVLAAEAIISEEQVSWTSTAAKQGLAVQGPHQQGERENNESY